MYSKETFFVRFVCLLFLPLTDYSEHSGIFFLHAWAPDRECYVTSSAILEIYRNFNDLAVETREALYKFDGPTNIRYIDNIIKYLKDNEYTTEKFYEECKSNIQITKRGWRIF